MATPRIPFIISMSDKVYDLENALQAQIKVLESDIWLGKMKDPVKAFKYADKIREVLRMEYFEHPWRTRSVSSLHRRLKQDYSATKKLKERLETLLVEKRTGTTNVQLSFEDYENLEEGRLNEEASERVQHFFDESRKQDEWDMEDKIKLLAKRCSLINFLQAVINSKELFPSLYKED